METNAPQAEILPLPPKPRRKYTYRDKAAKDVKAHADGLLGGHPPSTFPVEQLATLQAARVISGSSLSRDAMREQFPDLPVNLARALCAQGKSREEWTAIVGQKIRDMTDTAADKLASALRDDKIRPNNLPVTLAILVDKAQDIESRHLPSSLTQNNITILNGLSRTDLLSSLGLAKTQLTAI